LANSLMGDLISECVAENVEILARESNVLRTLQVKTTEEFLSSLKPGFKDVSQFRNDFKPASDLDIDLIDVTFPIVSDFSTEYPFDDPSQNEVPVIPEPLFAFLGEKLTCSGNKDAYKPTDNEVQMRGEDKKMVIEGDWLQVVIIICPTG
jgi:hypothetical protein